MTKKILTSVAAAALISTSAMAYNVSELSAMSAVQATTLAAAPQAAKGTLAWNSNSLFFPAFNAGNGFQSTIRVINTSSTNAVVAKVVFYDGKDSHELKDFNIYLSANDEWTGTIKIVDGVATLISTDDSAPIEASVSRGAYPMATETDPMKAVIGSTNGYVEVIGMVQAKANTAATTTTARTATKNNATYHGEHTALRADYAAFSADVRGATASSIFKNGVIQNNDVTFPFVDLKAVSANAPKSTVGIANATGNNTYYNFEAIGSNGVASVVANATAPNPDAVFPLAGDMRITNTANGTDMVLNAYGLGYATGGSKALVYLEGEKANIADIFINDAAVATGTPGVGALATATAGDPTATANSAGAMVSYPTSAVGQYDINAIETALNNITRNTAYITYGDAPVDLNYALFTSPFKRTIAQITTPVAATDTVNTIKTAFFNDADLRDTTNPNFGSYSLTASIYNMSEGVMSAGQFSPATTPTIVMKSEVDSTGMDITKKTKLPYYLDQAAANGFEKGYVKLSNTAAGLHIPAFVTQMMATTAGSQTVTSWINPTTR